VHLQSSKSASKSARIGLLKSGLKAGDRVVVEGTQKVKEGAVVNPKPFRLGDESNRSGRETNSSDANEPSK
jgi:hypothetical protein